MGELSCDGEAMAAAISDLVGGAGSPIDMGPGSREGLGRTLGDLKNGAGHIAVAPGHLGQMKVSASDRTSFLKRAVGRAGRLLSGVKAMLKGVLGVFRDKQVQQMVKFVGMGSLGIWLLIFGWTTFSHMMRSAPAPEPARRIEIRIRKPYTIQVAAYLKSGHADRYVAQLEKKGIKAAVKKTGAGGKTWYLVRVSEFTDKKSAVDYGNRLKSQKIIDDFFVSNK